ncbi:MAG: aminopeptidase [Thermoplasmata archaeon]|nr:aminopeptidase [Thermoplasmata archaeon]
MPELPSTLHRDAARNLVTKYLKVRAGENAVVESWDHTRSMASALVDEVRRAGGEVLLIHNDEDAWWRAIDRKQSKLLGRSSGPEWAALQAADVFVHFWGPADTDRLEKIPDRTGDEIFDWIPHWYEVARKSGLRGGRMTTGFVTDGRARQWSVDRAQWEESMLRACLVDPEELAQSGARLGKALSRGKQVRITHSNGTDLEVGLAGKAPFVRDGRARPWAKGSSASGMLENFPTGLVEVALDSRTATGVIHANRRTNIWWTWDAGGTLEFADGKLTSYSFEEGEEEFTRQYKLGTSGKDRASTLKIGLNPAVEDVPNLEFVERGCTCLVLGRNTHVLGSNRSNFMSWVMLAGAEIAVDGTPVVRAGQIL